MIIAQINPEEKHELTFDIHISGTKEEPTDIRFVIEGMPDPKTGEDVQDVFTIICRAVRAKDSITVYIPRLLSVFKSGSYKSRLEVVLENRLFIPLAEEIEILEPVKVDIARVPVQEDVKVTEPEVTVSITNVISEMLKQSKENPQAASEKSVQEEVVVKKPKSDPFKLETKVDDSWKIIGFKGIKNPFKA
jgi:hypothetical protein